MGDLEVILHILQLYELASRQKLNREKTTVFFSKATMEERRMELVEFLGVSEVESMRSTFAYWPWWGEIRKRA